MFWAVEKKLKTLMHDVALTSDELKVSSGVFLQGGLEK